MLFLSSLYNVLFSSGEVCQTCSSIPVMEEIDPKMESSLPEEKSSQPTYVEELKPQSHQEAVQVIFAEEDHKFRLNEAALEKILMHDSVKDRFVVVVSVAGAFRKGKSFILDFFLRYMKHRYCSLNVSDENWLGPEDAPLDGFSWRGGSERDTTGILMWSEIFLATLPTKEEVAIILLDTQGTFDSESTVRDCATVFALSTMISSIQIYNLSQNIQEDDLQHLQLFTEYGRLALEESKEKPFQKLQFLVRDWSYPYEAPYGREGGQVILNRRLQISNKQHPELQSIRKHIRSCFSDISCYLLPHPGLNIATNPNFDGRLSEIDNVFKTYLKEFVPMLLEPNELILKRIAGHRVRAKELLQYFKSYITIYSGDELPEPKSMLVATAEANNLTAVAEAKETYQSMMENVCGGAKPYLNSAHLETEHLRIKDRALEQFNKKRKMGGEEFSETYRLKLEDDLVDLYGKFKQHNESKNIFKAARTPAVYFSIAVAFYIFSGILGLFGMYALANLCNLIMGISLVTLITWSYVRYSGDMLDVGEHLDMVARGIWDHVLKPIAHVVMEKSIEHVMNEGQLPPTSCSTSNGRAKQS